MVEILRAECLAKCLDGVDVKSEFFAILLNLDAAATTDPKGLQEYAFSFG